MKGNIGLVCDRTLFWINSTRIASRKGNCARLFTPSYLHFSCQIPQKTLLRWWKWVVTSHSTTLFHRWAMSVNEQIYRSVTNTDASLCYCMPVYLYTYLPLVTSSRVLNTTLKYLICDYSGILSYYLLPFYLHHLLLSPVHILVL